MPVRPFRPVLERQDSATDLIWNGATGRRPARINSPALDDAKASPMGADTYDTSDAPNLMLELPDPA